MILLIDNYDSFSYNLYQLLGSFAQDILVRRNDDVTPDEIARLRPGHIVLSPGPGKPADAGVCEAVIARFAAGIPILGVCLGHQAICEAFGGTVSYAKQLMHGKQSDIVLDVSCPLFYDMPLLIKGARYHSLAAVESTLPPELLVTARAGAEIMAVRHARHEVYGVQFHPESIMTPEGKHMIGNFLRRNAA